MIKQRIFMVMLAGALVMGAPVSAEETSGNLIQNPGFESYEDKNGGIFGNYTEFASWERSGFGCVSEKTDVYEGATAMKLGGSTAMTVYQQITGLTDAAYDADVPFRLTVHYKAVTIASGGKVSLDAYWEHATTADGLKTHDAAKLQRVLSDSVQSEWQTLVVETTRPAQAKSFMLQFKATAKSYVLIDSLGFEALPTTAPDEPYITVTPKSLSSVSCEKGQSVDFPTLHIEQGNITGTTTFELSYTDADQFRLSRSSMSADESACDLIITYAPTKAGTHKAVLNIDNTNHTSLFQSITLNASCTDPDATPTITVTPSVIPTFETVAGKQVKGTFTVKSENCTGYVFLTVNHVQGQAFTTLESMLAKNYETEVTVYFTPLEAGTYQSTVTLTSEGATPVVVTLNGTASAKSEETIDWQTAFSWDTSHPYALLEEDFENGKHNETLVLTDWQNVAPLEARPWWGYDENRATPPRADNRCAKATAYQYGKDSTDIWEAWLVTPALDYKNAQGRVFTFDVMAEYLPEDGSSTTFEVYFIDPSDPEHIYFQDLSGSFAIPATGDENEEWRTFHLNLNNQPNIPDVFFMAFRYAGPNGGMGVVTYYVDNVSWGRTDLPTITPSVTMLIDSLAVVNVSREIGTITITGENLTEDISLEVGGNRYTDFSLSKSTLPKEGGEVTVTFESDLEGVHDAYVHLSSKGAADVFIPMAVLCKATAQGIENVQRTDVQCTKVLKDGKLYLMYKGRMYDVLGARVK